MGEPVDKQMNMGAGPVRFMIGIGRIAMAMAMLSVMMFGRYDMIVADRRHRTAVGEGQRQNEQQRKQPDDQHGRVGCGLSFRRDGSARIL